MLKVIYLVLGVAAITSCAAGPALAYAQILKPLQGFLLFAVGMLLGTVVTLIGIGVLIRGGSPMTYTAAALGVGPFLLLVTSILNGTRYPAINDIATELVYPPLFQHAQKLPENEGEDFTFPEKNKELIREHYSDLKSVAVESNPEDVVVRVSQLAKQQPGWTVTKSELNAQESFLEGYAETGVFKFKDDFVIRITKADEGSVIDMRSRSRDGQGDFGANAARIRSFLANF